MKNDFLRGYICAVCTLIKINGIVTTDARELFTGSGAATMNAQQLKDAGIDKNDIEVIQQYWASLYGT